jgi:hypothetical protein
MPRCYRRRYASWHHSRYAPGIQTIYKGLKREKMAWLIKGLAWLLLGVLALVAIWWAWNTGLELFWPIVGLLVAGISLHRSLKAFVEFWRSRISERVEIEVAAEKDTYLPGDVVNVSVRVTGKEDLDIQEGRVALVCANRYIYRYTTTDSDGDHVSRTSEVTEEAEAGNELILEEGTIRSGSYAGRDLVFKIPLTAAPSARCEITNVEWNVRITLLIRGAPDVIEEMPLTVLSTSESYATWAETAPELDSHGVCEMEFRLPGQSFRVGERIEESLLLTPRQDFEARSLRVELVSREIVPRASGNSSETVEASEVVDESPQLQMGLSREYTFAMEVPEAAGPSLKTEQTYVGWWLRAVVDRGLAVRRGSRLDLHLVLDHQPVFPPAPLRLVGTLLRVPGSARATGIPTSLALPYAQRTCGPPLARYRSGDGVAGRVILRHLPGQPLSDTAYHV